MKESKAEQVILEAAEKLFLEKGFSMTSTTLIAKAAGCNQALIHYYFRTKEHLFEAVFEKKMKMFVSTFFQAGKENSTLEDKLKQKIETHFDMLKANPQLPFLIFNELITNPKRLDKFKNKIKTIARPILLQIQSDLQTEIEKGNIRPITAVDLLITIFSLNVILFLGSPILKTIANLSDDEYQNFIEHRKRENVTAILKSLRP